MYRYLGTVVALCGLMAGALVFGFDPNPGCDAGGETPNFPALGCRLDSVYDLTKDPPELLGVGCVGQATPPGQACSGRVQKIVNSGSCEPNRQQFGTCEYFNKTIQQDALLAQCSADVDGDGNITGCGCTTINDGTKANTTYQECRDVASV